MSSILNYYGERSVLLPLYGLPIIDSATHAHSFSRSLELLPLEGSTHLVPL
jgi:hypothetical protein